MSLAFSTTPARSLGRKKAGWIGVDCGVRSIKLAQLERVGGSYRFAARWTIESNTDAMDRAALVAGGLKAQVKSIAQTKRLFSGRSCAAVLPTAAVDIRMLELPQGNADAERDMVAEELAGELGLEPAEFAFDYWRIEGKQSGPGKLSPVTAVATSKQMVRDFADQLLKSGLECHVLDGLPCVLARSIQLVQPADPDEPSVALDLAYSTPTLVLVHRGLPVFTRQLRGGSVQAIMRPLQDALKMNDAECEQLLDTYGLPAASKADAVAQRVHQLSAEALNSLVAEIDRTLHYLSQQYRQLQPQRIWLFGSGAKIKNISDFLADRLHLPTRPWGLEGTLDAGDAPYGVAAALSALAWEVGP